MHFYYYYYLLYQYVCSVYSFVIDDLIYELINHCVFCIRVVLISIL